MESIAESLDQLDFYWTQWRPRLEGLTDDEYFWEPVEGCWSIRPVADGWAFDFEFPPPTPPPFTTIAWRLNHIALHVFGLRFNKHFGDGSFRMDNHDYPATADAALAALDDQHALWREAIGSFDAGDWNREVGPVEGPFADRPYLALVLHLNRELFHHGGEIGVLRDLYRASGGRSV